MFRHRRRAFTLMDLLVTVAIGGLVVTVLAPTLKTARDQSQVATCLQNLRTLGQAANGYIVENGTFVFTFPFGYRPDTAPANFQGADLVTEFIWGGGVPDTRNADWDPELGGNPLDSNTDVYVLIESERPLNQYLTPGVAWCDPDRRGVDNPIRRQRPMQLPDFFKCPADCIAFYPEENGCPEGSDTTWEWWGTSYAANWYWGYFYSDDSVVDNLTGSRHQQILTEKLDRGASEWVLFMENRMNFALESATTRGCPYGARHLQGWHGQQDKHAAAFLDGSARYQAFDTSYVDGPGWTMWPNRPWDGSEWEAYQDN